MTCGLRDLCELMQFRTAILMSMFLPDAVAIHSAFFGAGTGVIVMDDVSCTGRETRLVDCTYTTTHNCGHSEDVSVRCNQGLLCHI